MTSRIKGPPGPKGPTDGPPRIGEVDEAAPADAVDEVKPAEVRPVEKVAPSSRASAAAPPDAVAEIAARLRAGELSVEQAVEALIDDAVRRQVGGATAGRAGLEARLRELLKQYAASDPQLTQRIRRLTLHKPS